MDGDRERTIAALVVARAWRDPAYLQQLVDDPRAVLIEEGIEVPPGAQVRVLQDTRENKHIVLPPDADPDDAEQAKALLAALVPMPPDSSATIVQSHPTVKPFVVPYPPPSIDPAGTSERALINLAAAGTVATFQDAIAVTEAVQTEVTVTTTTEVQDAETTTTAAAEAEVVAVVAGVLI